MLVELDVIRFLFIIFMKRKNIKIITFSNHMSNNKLLLKNIIITCEKV